jgi:hypothetical protein
MTIDARDARQRGELSMDIKSLLIGVLSVAVVVLGYLYYDSQQTKVRVDLPGIKIEGR